MSLYLEENVGVVKTPVRGLPQAGAASASDAPASAGMLGGQSAGGATGAGVPLDIEAQVGALSAGIGGDLAALGAGSAGNLTSLGGAIQGGFANINDKLDQLGDLFGS